MSSTKTSKKKNYSESELLEHPLCFTIVYFLRTICAQLHMLVPKQVNDTIDRYVGHGLCKVTALPSKLNCPITGETFFNKDVYKHHYQKNKKKIKKIKEKTKGKKPAPPNNLPTLPADWKMFVNPKNHHPDVIESVLDCRVGGTGRSGVWDYSTTKLKKLDAEIRPQHIQHHQKVHGGEAWMHAGRNIREVIPHGSKHGDLMALVGWYALEGYVTAEDYNYAKWTTGVQRKPTNREVEECSFGDSVYNPVKVKAHKSKGRDFGQCYLNALELFLSNESKGYVVVGYHAVCMPMLSIYTIALEPHVVYFDGKHYWDSTTEGKDMLADIGAFVPLVKIDKDNKVHKMEKENGNHYRVKNSMIFHEVKLCYAKMQSLYNDVHQMKTQMATVGADSFMAGLMGNLMSDTMDAHDRALKYECELFYRIQKGFYDDENIQMLCERMCDSAPWLTNPFLLDPTPGLKGYGREFSKDKADEITQKLISSIFGRREAIARDLGYSEGADGYDKVLKELKRWSLIVLPKMSTNDILLLTVDTVEEEAKKYLREFMALLYRSESKFKVGDTALVPNTPYRSMTSVEVLEVVYKEKEQQWCYKIKTNRIDEGEKEEWANEEALIRGQIQQFGIIQQTAVEKKTGSNPHGHNSDMMKSGIAGENKGNCQMSSLLDEEEEEFNKIVRREWTWHHQEKSNKCNYEARFLPDVIGRVTRAMSRKLTDREIQLVEEVRQVLEAEWKDKKKPAAKKRKMSDEETPVEKEEQELKRLELELKQLDLYHLKSIIPGKYNRHVLAACMLTWTRIASLSKCTQDKDTHTDDPVLFAKYIDLTICFEFNAEDRERVEEMADSQMERGRQMYRVMKMMSNKNLLDRLKQFHIEYMKISEEATNHFMEQYRIYFDQTMKYEMIVWTRLQELRPNFLSREDESHFKEVLEMLNSVEPEWRERADKDMRVVGVMEDSECENCGKNLNTSEPK